MGFEISVGNSWQRGCGDHDRDQCMYGMKTPSGGRMVAAKKVTKFMTNSKAIAGELSRRCDKSHVHQHLIGGRASAAQVYPPELCRAIVRGRIKE